MTIFCEEDVSEMVLHFILILHIIKSHRLHIIRTPGRLDGHTKQTHLIVSMIGTFIINKTQEEKSEVQGRNRTMCIRFTCAVMCTIRSTNVVVP